MIFINVFSIFYIIVFSLIVLVIAVQNARTRKSFDSCREQKNEKGNPLIVCTRSFEPIGDIWTEIYCIEAKRETKKKDKKETGKKSDNQNDDDEQEVDNHLVYLVIPGNPGISTAYVYWLQEMVRLFYENLSKNETQKKWVKMTAMTISHANHCMDKDNQNKHKIFTLEEQIQHKVQFLHYLFERKFAKHANIQFVIAGHSIGSYIALKCLDHLHQANETCL
ncbi:hypothetical protein RFI_01005 [Reticulomyxa filosa]|uniref:Lipid droplet-associated hydrolase n=1 Tax=Reticulomyxa filosa TaxID=46433 RepID=X6PED7_RETFI|nr:hypothetical protein RFI_01005 [Reticulomyxa filosa]|eukprot:ETO36057.1 hypothetical protein RFI_01005 [Reticulomyxa filosa]